jgi:hypothetical protein
MSQLSILEKLELKDEKNLLIQGLPSSIEKQFAKLSFAKNVTPLLKSRKIDWALVFAVNENQLVTILRDVLPALHPLGKLWVAFPKSTSKIASDLNRDCSWNCLATSSYEGVAQVDLDHVWSALWFKKADTLHPMPNTIAEELAPANPEVAVLVKQVAGTAEAPAELKNLFGAHPKAKHFFDTLPVTYQKEYITWIKAARKDETKTKRLELTLQRLNAGKRSPVEE